MVKDKILRIAEEIAIKRFGCSFSELSDKLQQETLRRVKVECVEGHLSVLEGMSRQEDGKAMSKNRNLKDLVAFLNEVSPSSEPPCGEKK